MNDTKPDAQLVAATHRGGRPRAAEPMSPLTTWVPTRVHDRLAQLAQKHGTSVSAAARTVLDRRTKP